MDYLTLEVLDDPSKVQWVVELETYRNLLVTGSTLLKTHRCNEDDFAQFFEFSEVD
jgi:hypothetical protein